MESAPAARTSPPRAQFFLKKSSTVAALCCSDRSLHTRRAAADNGNLSGIDRLAGTSVQFSGGPGFTAQPPAIPLFPPYCRSNLTLHPMQGSDLLRNAHLDFPGEIGVSQRRTGQNNAVHLADSAWRQRSGSPILNGARTGIPTSLLHLRVQIQCAPLGHIAGRTCVIEGVVNANVSQEWR